MRLGPRKSIFFGYFQMLFDGFKLFFSEGLITIKSDDYYFFLTTFLSFVLILLVYFLLPFYFDFCSWHWNFIFLFIEIVYMVFSFLLSAFFRKSKYGFLGAIRVLIGSLSFDIVFVLFCFIFINLDKDYNFPLFFWFLFSFRCFFYFLIMTILETSRAPFDFSEGERELVSGVNTEFRGVYFVWFFLSEYGSVLFYVVFLNNTFFNGFFISGLFIFFIIIFIRSCFPRYRVDKVVSIFWLVLLFISVLVLFFVVFL